MRPLRVPAVPEISEADLIRDILADGVLLVFISMSVTCCVLVVDGWRAQGERDSAYGWEHLRGDGQLLRRARPSVARSRRTAPGWPVDGQLRSPRRSGSTCTTSPSRTLPPTTRSNLSPQASLLSWTRHPRRGALVAITVGRRRPLRALPCWDDFVPERLIWASRVTVTPDRPQAPSRQLTRRAVSRNPVALCDGHGAPSWPPAGCWWPLTLDGGEGRRKIEQPRRAGMLTEPCRGK